MKVLRILALVILAIIIYLPLAGLVSKLVALPNLFELSKELIQDPAIGHIIRFTYTQAFISALISLVVGLPAAYFFSHYNFKGKKFIRNLTMIPFILPSILVVLAMIVYYGQQGFFSRTFNTGTFIYGYVGIIFAHVFYNFSLSIRIVGGSWEKLNEKLTESAYVLGDSKLKAFFRIELPLLWPSIAYSWLLAFLYSSLSFAIVLVFGGVSYNTLEVYIYTLTRRLQMDRAHLLAFVQLLISFFFILIVNGVSKRTDKVNKAFTISRARPLCLERRKLIKIVLVLYFALLLILFGGPLFSLFWRSLAPKGDSVGISLDNYQSLFGSRVERTLGTPLWQVFVNSLLLSSVSSLIAVSLSYVLARYYPKLRPFFLVPLGVSMMSYGFGVLVTLKNWVPTPILMLFTQIFITFPVVYSIVSLGIEEINPEYRLAASTLGSSESEITRRIYLPLLRPALSSAFAYGMALSLGDLTGVMLVGEGQFVTFTVALYRLIGHYSFPEGTALGTLVSLLFIGLFILIESGGGEKSYAKDRPSSKKLS